jgi:acetyl-CoA carboxylase alpha subunit
LAALNGKTAETLVSERYDKFRRIGVFEEEAQASL